MLSELSKQTETKAEQNETCRLRLASRSKLREQIRTMDISKMSTWHWARPDFQESLDWIMEHPRNLRKGEYLSDTPGKEVWRYTMPKGLGGITIIYKFYDCSRYSLSRRLGQSLAVREAANFAALHEIGVPVSDVLACGENRHVGLLRGAFIISKCIPDAYDGSILMPRGSLREQTRLRMGFCRKSMEHIARAHQCGCYHSAFHAHKILFPKAYDQDEPSLTWIDVTNCQFYPFISMRQAIPRDLVCLFVDMRLSADEIKELCRHYLNFNPNCGYNLASLWNAMVKLAPTS